MEIKLALTGMPPEWGQAGAFQSLERVLGGNLLSGPLPADILCNLPSLTYLNLGSNQFTGGLPSKWASCLNDIFQIEVMGNQLTGPAFPPAWLAPNSMLNLRHYEISDNPGLVGSLPPSLNWSRLELLHIRGNGMVGHIPEQWCHARFARTVQQIDTDAVHTPGFFSTLPQCVARDMPAFFSLRIQATDVQILAEADGSLVQLGEGAHGVVFLAQLQDSYVAVKVMEIPQETDSRAFWNEVAMLRRCVHSRIVPVYGVAVQGPLLMVAMQLMLGGSLRAALADPEQLDKLRWSNRGQQVAVDVAEAVAYLHEEAHVLHSDIKSGNVLLSQDWRAALSDLGVAQAMESAARTAVGGSNLYAAPEQLLGERCTLAADIYSLGLLLTELTTRRFIMMRGEWELPQPPDDCPQDVADLIGQCLSSDPRQRPTAAEVLRRLRASGGSGDGSLVKAGSNGTGWEESDPSYHCYWRHVTCDSKGKVMQIKWVDRNMVNSSLARRAPTVLLLPELAQLQHLATLNLEADVLNDSLPPEWFRPGAFPRLQTLILYFPYLLASNPLPPIEPGALPRLERFNLMLDGQEQPVPLPASWGTPGAWPLLRELVLGLGLGGTFPAAWQANGSFPRLHKLHLGLNRLSGSLPTALMCNHPLLDYLKLSHNQLSGRLPDHWAMCQASIKEIDLSDNQLTGPAFPSAWIAPNSTLNLESLWLSVNPRLTGTLPASLNWSNLRVLYVLDTNVHGGIPAQWCNAAFAQRIRIIFTDAMYRPAFYSSLPQCAERSLPSFMAWAAEMQLSIRLSRDDSRLNGTATAGMKHVSGISKLLLLLLALVAASAAAAAAAVHQRRRRGTIPAGRLRPRRQQHGGSVADSEEIELLERELCTLDGGGMRHRRPPLPRELAPGRARLKALAQRQLGGTALLSGRPEAQLLSLLNGHSEQALAPAQGHGHTLPGDSSAGGLHDSEAHRSNGSRSSGAGAKVQLVQGWGLPTDSLRMQATNLQFVAESDGTLVQLGEGAHGVVYLAKMQETYVAVKVFAQQPGMDSQAFWQEVALLRRCVHPRIVPVYGVAVQGGMLMVAMQLMLGGSLRTALLNSRWHDALRWDKHGRRVALDVAEAVAYLHEEAHILHSDIKSANVLLSQDWRAALTDLGVAQVMESTARTAVGGSNLYAAPEQLLGERCTLAADIYSLGLLLAELTTGHVIVKRGQWELPRPPDDCPQDVADLIAQCLQSEFHQRPTAAEVLRRLRASSSSGGGSSECSG
ncbi:serine threonine- kinase receptor R831 [Chlorella sorokiniana]|uniref:non-specific serine/threonine protein kinase n=1 Tax=Chlorella sorokiniana TaxID=3076 RepID=A0A2P6TMY8_CHLSO|nr:serine threonine- kinase receptor R831 [Chlorella sorokiniana]|eukprot:PRW45691.1 serine threonine- kinase receptor R831 [Chlorella sorokiniana]